MTVIQDQAFTEQLAKELRPIAKKLVPFLVSRDQDKYGVETKRAEEELVDFLSGKKITERFAKANSLINEGLKVVASPREIEQIHQEWTEALPKLASFMDAVEPGFLENYQQRISIQGQIGISSKTVDFYYQCGTKLYNEKLFEDAEHVFFLLSFLCGDRPNVWISLGLTSKELGNIENAVYSFSFATILAPHRAIGQVYTANCYAQVKDYDKAIESLELAEKISNANPTENSSQLMDYIVNLTNYYKRVKK